MDQKSIQPQNLFDGVAEDTNRFDDGAIQDNTPDNAHEVILQNLSSSPTDPPRVKKSMDI